MMYRTWTLDGFPLWSYYNGKTKLIHFNSNCPKCGYSHRNMKYSINGDGGECLNVTCPRCEYIEILPCGIYE